MKSKFWPAALALALASGCGLSTGNTDLPSETPRQNNVPDTPPTGLGAAILPETPQPSPTDTPTGDTSTLPTDAPTLAPVSSGGGGGGGGTSSTSSSSSSSSSSQATPTPTPTPKASPTPTPRPSGSASASASPTPTPSPSATPTPTPAPTSTPVASGATGQAAQAYGAHVSFLGSGMNGPNGLAIQADDTLYEADYFGQTSTVHRVTQSGATSAYVQWDHFIGPAGLAFDKGGNLLVAGYGSNTLEKVPPGGGSHTALVSSGLNHPVWPAVDSHGTIFLADYSNNRIVKVGADGSTSSFATVSAVNAIAIDPQDNLWVTNWSGNIYKMDEQGHSTTIASGLSTLCGIAWCPNYLAVVTYGGEKTKDGRLLLVDFSGKSYEVASQLDRASSVIFDSHLNIYTANCGDTALRKFSLH